MEATINEAKELKVRKPRKASKLRAGFKMDTPPYPVRSLWESASQEAKTKAHQTGVLILEHWVGRMTRQQLAQKLETTPLRAWQLSKKALAGMVTGLLKQPSRPPKGSPSPLQEETRLDTSQLKKEVEKLRRENQLLTELVDVLRTLPGNENRPLPTPNQKKIGRPKKLDKTPRDLAQEPKQAQG